MVFKFVLSVLSLMFPWPIRRSILNAVLGYKIHSGSRIGLSIIIPDYLEMGDGAKIGHFNVCKGVEHLCMGEQSIISTMNWITGVPVSTNEFYQRKKKRNPSLYLGKHSAITNRHYIDCTDEIRVGNFTTMAGVGSQFLTHSINLNESIQDCSPISIGDYCFIGTNSVLLPGSSLGHNCVLSASSLLNKKYTQKYFMYGGVPARPIRELAHDMKYFSRTIGFVK